MNKSMDQTPSANEARINNAFIQWEETAAEWGCTVAQLKYAAELTLGEKNSMRNFLIAQGFIKEKNRRHPA